VIYYFEKAADDIEIAKNYQNNFILA
jgi:hypothetical protein